MIQSTKQNLASKRPLQDTQNLVSVAPGLNLPLPLPLEEPHSAHRLVQAPGPQQTLNLGGEWIDASRVGRGTTLIISRAGNGPNLTASFLDHPLFGDTEVTLLPAPEGGANRSLGIIQRNGEQAGFWELNGSGLSITLVQPQRTASFIRTPPHIRDR